jgi:hypothetical protein
MPSQDCSPLGQFSLARRDFLGTILGAGLAGALTCTRHRLAEAQGAGLVTPTPLGPAVPPEVSAHAGDWPVPQGNLAGHRAAANSPITAATVSQRDVAWRLPLTAISGIGAVTAIPVVVGDTV